VKGDERLGQARILVVDDETPVRELWADALSTFGYDVAAAGHELRAQSNTASPAAETHTSSMTQ
jgi:CheY-like chemotaxis protein